MTQAAAEVADTRRLSIWHTTRRALAVWWEHLGLSCAVSAILVISLMGAMALLARAGMLRTDRQPGGSIIVAALILMGSAWLWAGLHRVAHAMAHRQDSSVTLVFKVSGANLLQAWGLAVIQLLGAAACALNIWFYFGLRSPLGTVLGVVFSYVLVLWLMACLYHWPLMTAAQLGLIPSDTGRIRLRAVLRNGFILLGSAPAYTAAFGAIALAINLPLVASGIGLVLVTPALFSIFCTQAVRDHMVRLGLVPPPDEGPVVSDRWQVPQG